MQNAPTLQAAPPAQDGNSSVSGDGEHANRTLRVALNRSTELSVERQLPQEHVTLRRHLHQQEQYFGREDMHLQKRHEGQEHKQRRLQEAGHHERERQPPEDTHELQGQHEQQQLSRQEDRQGEIAPASTSLLDNEIPGKSVSSPEPLQTPAILAADRLVTCKSSDKEADEGASAGTVLFKHHLQEAKPTSGAPRGLDSAQDGVSSADRGTVDADEKFDRNQRGVGGAKTGVSAAEGVSETREGACVGGEKALATPELRSDGGARENGVDLAGARGLGRAAGTGSTEGSANDSGRGAGSGEKKVSNGAAGGDMDSTESLVSGPPGGVATRTGSGAGTAKERGGDSAEARGGGSGGGDGGRHTGGRTTSGTHFLSGQNGSRSVESAATAVVGGYGSTEAEEGEGFADANIYVVHPPSLMETGLLPQCENILRPQHPERRRRCQGQHVQETERTATAYDATYLSADSATEKRTRKCRSTRIVEAPQARSANTEAPGRVHGRDTPSAATVGRSAGVTAAAPGDGEEDHAAVSSSALCGFCRQEGDGLQDELLRICKDLILSDRIRSVQWNSPQVLQGQLLQLAVVVMPAAKVVAARDASIKKWREKYASFSIRVDLVPASAIPAKSVRGKPSALSCQFWEAQAFPIDTQETVTVSVFPFSYSAPPTTSVSAAAAGAAAAPGCPAGSHVSSAKTSPSLYDSSHERQQIEQQQPTQPQQQHQRGDEEAQVKARAADEAGGSAATVAEAVAAEVKRRREHTELSRRFSEDYSSARVAEEEEDGTVSIATAQPRRGVRTLEQSSDPSRAFQLQQEQQQQQAQQQNRGGGGAVATEAEHAATELFCYIADIKIPMTVNPQYLGKPLELELFLTVRRPADVELAEHVDAMRDSVQLPLDAWAACHGLSCMHTASMQSALCAPSVDLLAVPFSSCFTGGRYGAFQRLQAAAAATVTGTSAAGTTTAAGAGGSKQATTAPGGGQAEKNAVAGSPADSAAAAAGSSGARGHQTDSLGRMGGNAAAEGNGDTAAQTTTRESTEEQENKDEAVLTQNWWAPPNVNSSCSGPAAAADAQIHGDRISWTMELLMQSFASLANTELKDGWSSPPDAEEGGLSQPQQHRIVCPLTVHRPLQVTTALVDSFMYVQIENVTERTAITIENVVLRSVHSYAEGDLPVLLHAGDQYSLLLRLDEFFLSHQAPRWDSKSSSSSSGTAGDGAGGGGAGGRMHARGAGVAGGSSLKGKYSSSGKVVLPLCLKWQVEGFFLSGTPAVWSQFGAECQLPTRTPLQVTITCRGAAAASEVFTAVLSVANNEAQEVELMVLLPRDIHYQQQAQTYQQQHYQHYGKPLGVEEPKQLSLHAAPGDPAPLIPLTSKKDLGRIPPGGSQSTYLQFLATRSGPHPLPPILLLDRKNNRKILARGGQVVVVS